MCPCSTRACLADLWRRGSAPRRRPAGLWDTQPSPTAPLSAPRRQTQPCRTAAWPCWPSMAARIHRDPRDTPLCPPAMPCTRSAASSNPIGPDAPIGFDGSTPSGAFGGMSPSSTVAPASVSFQPPPSAQKPGFFQPHRFLPAEGNIDPGGVELATGVGKKNTRWVENAQVASDSDRFSKAVAMPVAAGRPTGRRHRVRVACGHPHGGDR